MANIKILSESRALIAPLQTAADADANKILNQAIEDVARVDGDRVLDQFEAEALRSAAETIVPAGQPINAAAAGQIRSALGLRISEMKAQRASSTEAIFTSQGAALDKFRGKILGSIDETVRRANGKPVEINTMIFAFTDAPIADHILDVARRNPNVTFRLLTDWSELAAGPDAQSRRLAETAQREHLNNVQVKFKKDDPYVWNDTIKRPQFVHNSTKGLNHHKGFVALADGRPEKMTFGSFNWSLGAMTGNYENLMLLDRADSDNRRIMEGYQKEFEGFWNNDAAALTFNEARTEKNRLWGELYAAHGVPWTPSPVTGNDPPDTVYHADNRSAAFDVNSLSDADATQLSTVVGSTLAKKVQTELKNFGRFDCWTELMARVPDLAKAPTWAREKLMANLEYGDSGLSINSANVDELRRAGLTKKQADALVAFRQSHGAFESLDELDAVAGFGKKTIDKLRETLTDDQNIGTYSASLPGQPATTGWSSEHHGTLAVPSTGAASDPAGTVVPSNRSTLVEIERNMAAPVVDMLRRAKPGDTYRMAMYGISTTAPEYAALKEAATRGVKMRIVLYKEYNEGAIDDLKRLKAQGLDIDVRIISARVMHEKFGQVGDDVFNGSANWSSSSITKHTEDRFLFRNMPELADRFVEEFNRLWEKGRAA